MTNKIPSNSWQLAYNFFKNVFTCYLRIAYIYSLCFSQIRNPSLWLLPELTHYISSQFSYIFFLNPPSQISAFNMDMVLEPSPGARATHQDPYLKRELTLSPNSHGYPSCGHCFTGHQTPHTLGFWLACFVQVLCMLWVHKCNNPDMFSKHSFTVVFPDASFVLTRAWTITG